MLKTVIVTSPTRFSDVGDSGSDGRMVIENGVTCLPSSLFQEFQVFICHH